MEEIFEEWRQWVERHQGHKPGLTDAMTSTPRPKPLESIRKRGKSPYPRDQPGFSSPEAKDVTPPPLPPRLNRPAREREPQAAQGNMFSGIDPSHAATRQDYATDTVATRPGVIPSHAATRQGYTADTVATRPEIIPSHAATRQDYMISELDPSHAATRQDYATDTVATRPGVIPSHAATRQGYTADTVATRW